VSERQARKNKAESPLADRRTFFRFGLNKLLVGLASLVEQVAPLEGFRTALRPPGALSERDFLKTCYRCGSCVNACPAKAIRPMQTGDEDLAGTPYIDPDLQACVLCDALACMEACPSGALVPLRRRQIRMGTARISESRCLRNRGVDCRLCLQRCPIGPEAIGLTDGGAVEIRPEGCVGCGVCQQVCPAKPKAVTVEPA